MMNAYFLTFHSSSYAQALKEFKSLAFLECEKGRSVHAGNVCQGLEWPTSNCTLGSL